MVEKETAKHFDSVSGNWENKGWVNKEDFDKKVLKIVDLSGDEIGLDIGIGTGALAKKFNCTMYGLDISTGMMEKNPLPRHRLIVGSGDRAPFMDSSFDFVTSRNLIKHVNDIPKVLLEMKRVLKRDGKLLIIESTPFTKEQCDIPTMAVRVVEPYHPRFFSKSELATYLQDAGFEILVHDLEVMRFKWLQSWAKAKNARDSHIDRILELYKGAPEFFIKEQHVELFEEEKEILSDFPWSIILARKV